MHLSCDYQDNGFLILQKLISDSELNRIKYHILSNIADIYSVHGEEPFSDWEELVTTYSTVNDQQHSLLSAKSARTFKSEQVNDILSMAFVEKLKTVIGSFLVTQEECIGYPEIYWRITRPFQASDIGPLHADGWFWDLNPSWKPDYFCNRIKLWVPLEIDIGKNGLNVFPGSHNMHFDYTIHNSEGKQKPVLSTLVDQASLQLLMTKTMDAVLFHDRLLHGGAPNLSCKPRISFEMTCSRQDG